MNQIITIDLPIHDARIASRMILDALREEPGHEKLRDRLTGMTEDSLMSAFGYTNEEYEDAIVKSCLGLPTRGPGSGEIYITAESGSCMFWADDDVKPLIVNANARLRAMNLPRRTVRDLPEPVFRQIVECALDNGRDWREEEGFPHWFHLISPVLKEIIEITDVMNDVLFGDMRHFVRDVCGVSGTELATRLFIPLRTVENWLGGKSECKPYLRLMIAREMGVI